MKRTTAILLVSVLPVACGGNEDAQFGAPRQVPASDRPMAWDVPAHDRVDAMSVGAARPAGGEAGAGAPSVTVQVPDGWKQLPPSGRQFRDAEFQVAGQPDTECYLTLGVGGGAAGNLGRWYGQFGRSDVPSVESLPAIELAGKPARLVALDGAMGGKADWATLIAFFAQGQQVTSLKFTGPRAVVQQHRDGFLALARSIQLGSGAGSGAGAGSGQRQAPPIPPERPTASLWTRLPKRNSRATAFSPPSGTIRSA